MSRILGFVSLLALARAIGVSTAGSNTFSLANQLPNNIYAIVAGGLLSAVIVPQIVRAGSHDDGGERFVNRIVTLGGVVFILIAAIATACAPLLVNLYAQQSASGIRGYSQADLDLATAFAFWCLPQVLFYALYSLLGEVLNARGRFGAFTWAPVVNNVVAIAGILAFSIAFGSRGLGPVASWTPAMVATLAGTATLGVAAQAATLALFWRHTGLRYRPEFTWRGVGLGSVGKAAGWTFAMVLVTQLAGIVQTNVATLAGSTGASTSVLRYSWLIFMLPHSIVAVSIATAYFTRMSGHAHRGDLAAVRDDLSASLRTIGLIMVFASVGLIVLAYPFAAVFAHTEADVRAMGAVLIAFLLGLVPFSALFLLQRVFYALEDTRTPFVVQVFQAVLFVAGALLVSTLPSDRIAFGIALVTSVAGVLQMILAAVLVRRRLGMIGAGRIARQHLQYLLGMVPTAVVGAGTCLAMGAYTGGYGTASVGGAIVTLVVSGASMAFIYVVALGILRVDELRDLVRPVFLRLRRR